MSSMTLIHGLFCWLVNIVVLCTSSSYTVHLKYYASFIQLVHVCSCSMCFVELGHLLIPIHSCPQLVSYGSCGMWFIADFTVSHISLWSVRLQLMSTDRPHCPAVPLSVLFLGLPPRFFPHLPPASENNKTQFVSKRYQLTHQSR